MYYGIISDGVHTHPAALRIAFKTNSEGLILVSDAISAMGLEHGKHKIGQLAIEIKDRKAYIADTDTLCGSIAALDECVRIFRKETGKVTPIVQNISLWFVADDFPGFCEILVDVTPIPQSFALSSSTCSAFFIPTRSLTVGVNRPKHRRMRSSH